MRPIKSKTKSHNFDKGIKLVLSVSSLSASELHELFALLAVILYYYNNCRKKSDSCEHGYDWLLYATVLKL